MSDTNTDNENGWREWKHYVLNTLKDLSEKIDSIDDTQLNNIVKISEVKEEFRKNIESLQREILVLQVKFGLWSGLTGFFGSALLYFIIYVIKYYVTKI